MSRLIPPSSFVFAASVAVLLAALFLGPLATRYRSGPSGVHAPEARAPEAVAEVDRDGATAREPFGQTLYVPAYSAIYASDKAHAFNLAVTLVVRNTDRERPIVITEARYYDRDGRLVRDFLKKPLRVGPLASMEFYIEEQHTGGAPTGFLVEWVAEQAVSEPVAESLMIHTGDSQGITLTGPGRVLTDRSRSRPDG